MIEYNNISHYSPSDSAIIQILFGYLLFLILQIVTLCAITIL